MKLEELSTVDEDYFEQEEEALRDLPRDKEGLAELLDYLVGMDSYDAWKCLFEEYSEIMSETLFYEMKEKANQLFCDPYFEEIEY